MAGLGLVNRDDAPHCAIEMDGPCRRRTHDHPSQGARPLLLRARRRASSCRRILACSCRRILASSHHLASCRLLACHVSPRVPPLRGRAVAP